MTRTSVSQRLFVLGLIAGLLVFTGCGGRDGSGGPQTGSIAIPDPLPGDPNYLQILIDNRMASGHTILRSRPLSCGTAKI
jgi:hypothetical protein